MLDPQLASQMQICSTTVLQLALKLYCLLTVILTDVHVCEQFAQSLQDSNMDKRELSPQHLNCQYNAITTKQSYLHTDNQDQNKLLTYNINSCYKL